MARRITRRRSRYLFYRSLHFLPDEALELAKLRRRDYYEVRVMARERAKLWEWFKGEADKLGYSPTRIAKRWKGVVHSWYLREKFVQKGFGPWKEFPPKNIWLWFDDVSAGLPEERRYTNDQSSRRKKGLTTKQRDSKARFEAAKATHQRFIDGLMRTAVREPWRDKELTVRAQNMGFTGKSLLRTGKARGVK